MVVTADIGPRVIHFAAKDGENMLHIVESDKGNMTNDDTFRFYGGHRLWRAPEDRVLTYFADNNPVEVAINEPIVTFTTVPDRTGLQKQLQITMATTNVTLTHKFYNASDFPMFNIALWGITMMRAGGFGLLPLAARVSHTERLLPTQQLILWGYTDLGDPRWQIASDYIGLYQDESLTDPQKIGHASFQDHPWLLYVHPLTGTFVKQAAVLYQAEASYPDMGAQLELFTNGEMLELETLSPLFNLHPEMAAEHVERWWTLPERVIPRTEEDVRRIIAHVEGQIA